MREPTPQDIMDAISRMEKRINKRLDQLEQAVRELKDDHDDIEYLNDQLQHQNKQIWKSQKLYRELYREVKSLKPTASES